ncbi:lysylphosphatidylglycerol synthase transmembrane domain-containing protein [Defluviimonas sp. SAOS-178_SWC]|uniref:lysylphosphatidylglycerol synthase transmembrane domain-containing protein n=1 Tax=Defluviimonas sp. SAOS-178_SWC TaxID=3121287 RepID=UPI003221B118
MSADLPLPKSPSPAPTRRLRDIVVIGGLLVLFAAGLIGLAAATGWEETRAQIARLALWQGAVLLALSLANYLLRGLRWHFFARRLGLATTLPQDLRHFLGGFAMVVTPGRVGELVRMRWLKRETGWAFERTAPLALVDRASDLAAMALLLGLSVSLATTGVRGAVPVTLLALAAAVVATRPKLLAGLVTLAHRMTGRVPRIFGRLRASARSLDRFAGAGATIPALFLGIGGWFAEGYAFHLLLGWMGADIGLMKAIAIFVFATLAGGLTGAPGGVGGAEAAMIALLAFEGIPMEVSVPATAIIRVTTLWFALGIGMAVFPFAERHSLRGANALEDR